MNAPQRPNVSNEVSIEALERLVLQLIVTQARTLGGSAHMEQLRDAAFEAFTASGPLVDPQRQQVADHMDWLMSLAVLTLRHRGA